MKTRVSIAVATMILVGLTGSPLSAQTAVPINYAFDLPLAKVTSNPCTGGFTLVQGTAHLAIAASKSTSGFQLSVTLSGSGNGIDVSADGTPIVVGAQPQYLYASRFGATTTFPEGVPQYFERTLIANDYLMRDSLTVTNDSYMLNSTFRLVFSNGLPSLPVLESVDVVCK